MSSYAAGITSFDTDTARCTILVHTMSTYAAAIAEPAQTCLYPRPHPHGEEWQAVARRKKDERPGSGARLAVLRKAAGYTQQELAQELGVSRRMVAYYERATPLRRRAAKPDSRLARRMQQIERMNPKEKRQVLQILDALVEREQLRASKG